MGTPERRPERGPAARIDAYLADDGAMLRRRGLRGKSIELYAFLCRLCGPGEDRVIYAYQYELAEDLQRLAGTSAGYKPADLTKKLQTLQLRGFVRIVAGDGYCVEIVPADAVPVATSRSRLAVVAPAGDRQGLLFDEEHPVLALFSPDSEPNSEPDSDNKKRNSVSVSVSGEKRNSVSVSPADRSIYPRAPAVDVEDEDEVESTDEGCAFKSEDLQTASDPVTPAEAATAAAALGQVEARWKRAGLRPPKDPDQLAEDRSILRRAHVLLQRGLLPETVFAEAVDRPVEQRERGRRVAKPYAQATKRLFQHRGFGRLLGAVREPIAARPDSEGPKTRGSPPPPMTSEDFLAAAAQAGIRLPASTISKKG